MPKDARLGLGFGILLIVVIMVVFLRKPAAPINKIGDTQRTHSNILPTSSK